MNKLEMLGRIKELYEFENINIIQYLRNMDGEKVNSLSDIMISYDFQAGTYIESYYKDAKARFEYLSKLSSIIDGLKECTSILECGTGEATILVPLIEQVNRTFSIASGFDISWSRVRYAQKFAAEELTKETIISLVVGDMFNIPCADNSYDIVFTRQAIEPNRGREKEILREIYRVTNKYLILIEPAYELANKEARRRMDEHGYIQHLYSSAQELGLNVVLWELYGQNECDENPVGIMIIEKDNTTDAGVCGGWRCPLTKSKLIDYGSAWYSRESLLAYPVVGGVPMLTVDNGIVATKFESFM